MQRVSDFLEQCNFWNLNLEMLVIPFELILFVLCVFRFGNRRTKKLECSKILMCISSEFFVTIHVSASALIYCTR